MLSIDGGGQVRGGGSQTVQVQVGKKRHQKQERWSWWSWRLLTESSAGNIVPCTAPPLLVDTILVARQFRVPAVKVDLLWPAMNHVPGGRRQGKTRQELS